MRSSLVVVCACERNRRLVLFLNPGLVSGPTGTPETHTGSKDTISQSGAS